MNFDRQQAPLTTNFSVYVISLKNWIIEHKATMLKGIKCV